MRSRPPNGVARRSLSRLLQEKEAERERLRTALDAAGDQALGGTERLAQSVRQATHEARGNFAAIVTSEQMNAFIGERTVQADGTFVPSGVPKRQRPRQMPRPRSVT